MDEAQRGKLILKAVPGREAEKKVVMLLLKFAKTASADELTEKVRNTPYELSNDIEAKKAVIFIEAFENCGATAVFIPHLTATPTPEKFTPVQRPPVFSFDSDAPSPDKATAPPIQVKPKKNGVRRLTMMLVVVLLFLSVGFLIWQLWPVIGAKIQEMITFLKNNI